MSSSNDELARAGKLTREDTGDVGVQVGQWYWMDTTVHEKVWLDRPRRKAETRKSEKLETVPHAHDYESYDYKDVRQRRLLCVTHVGSNYALLEGAPYEGSYTDHWHGWRVHFDEFAQRCTLEPDAARIVDGYVKAHRAKAAELMAAVQTEMEKLGVVQVGALEDGASHLAGTSTALAKSTGIEVKRYNRDLEVAKRIDLPHMFERIKLENRMQAAWMRAEMLPLLGHVEKLKPVQEAIEGRLLSVELYAGLAEEILQVRGGAPAAMDTPVHLLQRRHYMDEECLANYEAGGMDYREISAFDEWLARDDNFNRVLPFPRCVVAFRIRRYDKVRHSSVPSDFIQFAAEKEEDRKTFLYIRNGARMYRLETRHDFGAQLFPDFDAQDGSASQLYFKEESHDKFHIISGERLAGMREDEAAAMVAKAAEWQADRDKALAAGEKWHDGKQWSPHSWHYGVKCEAEKYQPLNTDTVYYDDIIEQQAKEVRAHNRLATVLQGLVDRSEVFHPHPRWQLWEGEGFAKAITLVYDDSRALHAGARPDFEAYRARLNATLEKGSMCTGQWEPWIEREREKEHERRRGNWRLDYNQREVSHWWRPDYEGPQVVHEAASVGTRGVLFRWTRPRKSDRSWRSREGDALNMTFTCPASKLLNVSAYTPGDFKQFYADPRTREDYLEWAPLLLAAEDWHAGKTPKDGRGERRRRR